jgi:hypothetical protein
MLVRILVNSETALVWILTTTLPLVMLGLWTRVAAEQPFQGYTPAAFTAYYLSDAPLLYVLLAVLASNGTTAAALKDRRWQWFRITEPELEHRLFQLHQAKVISFYRAGSVVDLRLPAETAEQLVREVWS